MARVGRGRSRGGRILDVPELGTSNRGMGHGKIVIGRGMSVIEPVGGLREDSTSNSVLNTCEPTTDVEEIKKTLEEQLFEYEQRKDTSFIHITLDYFKSNEDVPYYIDKVLESLLRSSFLVEKFTMSFRLITLLKKHGEEIKLQMLTKLQTTFQDMLVVMKDTSTPSEVERERVCNFCELLGQLYFRFRLLIDSLERYNVFAMPVIECMFYLLKVQHPMELRILVKLIMLNYSDLSKLDCEKMMQLTFDIRKAIMKSTDSVESTWLLCALDFTYHPHCRLPPYMTSFYAEKVTAAMLEPMYTSPMELLVDIPSDIVETQMDNFNITVDEYNKHRFITV